ncbi:LysR substrate-binding domain-containing protein [Pseudomonas benzenivorans]|uniref:LysR family transcriptional regulator n=1 Tax=Pseudomonas benzenivorans TaxID=556533 RepID=A0ABY5H571_9PSED|nr:LysR substrate-binding domain-containing protein [Pseudomonas benzenivorans]UTW07360.1 LysR family transcriptional regulator [Pseudomonas benzenivorans]
MSYTLPHLPWLRSFEAAARNLSFSAAAGELHLTPAAVSLQVRSLEEYLGFQLFERLPRGVRLTDMGRAYLPSVRKAFDELSLSTAGLFGSKGDRSVTIRSTASFAQLWLAPRLNGFLDTYPEIEVRLFTAIWADALEADQADIDIRFGDGRWEGFEVEPLRKEPSIPVCSPSWLERAKDPGALAQLAQQQLIHIMGCEDLWTRWFRAAGIEDYRAAKGIQVDSSLIALELACAGSGFALVLRSFAEPHIASGRLVSPFAGELAIEQSHYLLLPEGETRPRPDVLLFREWLLETAKSA